MHAHVWRTARSTSWYVIIVAIYVLMTLALFGVKINLIPALSILLFVQCSSWAISGCFFSAKLTEQKVLKPTAKVSLLIGVSFILLFVIITALTKDWRFLLAAIPPIVLNIAIMLVDKKE